MKNERGEVVAGIMVLMMVGMMIGMYFMHSDKESNGGKTDNQTQHSHDGSNH